MGFHWGWNKVAIPGIRADGAPRGSISERKCYLSTPKNNRYLINYVIVPYTAVIPSHSSDAFDFNLLHNPENRVFYTSSQRDSESAARTLSSGAASPVTPTSQWRAWQIAYAADVDAKDYLDNARVPFWIVRVPSQIIDNHGGIWSDNNMALMAAIFRLHRPLVTKQVIVSRQRKTERMFVCRQNRIFCRPVPILNNKSCTIQLNSTGRRDMRDVQRRQIWISKRTGASTTFVLRSSYCPGMFFADCKAVSLQRKAVLPKEFPERSPILLFGWGRV
jgi:hypothetical protein